MRRTSIGIAAFFLLAAGCGGGTETGQEDTATTAAPTTPATTAAPTTTVPTTTTVDDRGTGSPSGDDYGYDYGGGTSDDTDSSDDTADSSTITVAETEHGTILVDAEGYTLYIFTQDDQSEPTCTGACAGQWPPFLGEATAGEGLDSSLLGTAAHPEEGTVATYNGWPLYYYAGDIEPGDTSGQGVGGVWYVIGADGSPIRGAR